jgi:hypothetical protein
MCPASPARKIPEGGEGREQEGRIPKRRNLDSAHPEAGICRAKHLCRGPRGIFSLKKGTFSGFNRILYGLRERKLQGPKWKSPGPEYGVPSVP